MEQRQTKNFLFTRKVGRLGVVAVACLTVATVGLILAFSNHPVHAAVAGAEHLEFIDNADKTGYEVRGFNAAGAALSNVELTIPNMYNGKSVTGIYSSSLQSSGAFFNRTKLVSVSFESPSNVKSIGGYAFYGCSGLTSVTIPSSVTDINKSAFQGCNRLTSVTIPSSVTSIGDSAFQSCSYLTTITIPSSVTSIGNETFASCYGMTSVTIQSGVTSIGDYAFDHCTGLTSITIPASVTSIGINPFRYCSGLTSITVNLGNTVYRSEGSNSIISNTNELISGCKNTIIPASVTSIGNSAFYYCTGLTSITIPVGVTSVGTNAFYLCTDLTSITIQSDVMTSIGDYAFERCTGLTSITIPASMTSIGRNAFDYCSGLTSITIPSNVTSIGIFAFDYCSGLTSLTIQSGVTSIGDYAFDRCTGLTSVTIPASVTNMGINPFRQCSGLASITVDSENTVYRSESKNCIIRNSDNSLISGCKNTVISALVKRIEQYAFCGHTGFTTITIPTSVTSIGTGAFLFCAGLITITIPSGVKSIGDSVFRSCTGLTSITMSSVTSIGDSAFESSGFTAITIPPSVTNIGTNAFRYCSGLKTIKLERFSAPSTITTLGTGAFTNVNLTKIIVPYADGVAKAAYSAAANWSAFASIIFEDLPDYDGIVRLRSSGGAQLSEDIKKVWRYGESVPSTLQLPTAETMNSAVFTNVGQQFYGYRFEGWYNNRECTGSAVTQIPAGASGTLYYYAKWAKL